MAKKIGACVSLGIIAILIIATIIMANINLSYSVQCATPSDIYVSLGSETSQPASAEEKTAIMNYINSASQEKMLTALFNGNLNKHATLTSKKGTLSTESSKYYVRYTYNESQTLKVNGKDYMNEDKDTVKYDDLIFVIEDVEDATVVKVYVIPDDSNNMRYTYYYTVDANLSDLYSYLDANF